ncbi:EAL domain-containing protein [Glaciecola sp. 2405UD65-10]|uniref:EAL domain-containing protein n=1 Tax=Glaciecola sp. 2405UD65-10 TaxID=3397244 RepID=UPI003B5BDB42
MELKSEINKAKVLIVEDCITTSVIIARAISDMAQISVASTVSEGLRLARSILPEIILLDIQLGTESGLDLCKILKQDPITANTVVIFITASGDDEVEIEAFERGGSDFVRKPINTKVLRARIGTQITLFRKHQSLKTATRLYNQIISKLPNYVSYWNSELENYYHNDEQMQWFDYPPNKQNLRLQNLVSGKEFGTLQRRIENLKERGNDHFELSLTRSNTHRARHVMVSLISGKMYQNSTGFIMVLTDITERKQHELLLEEEKDKYQIALQSIGEGVIATNNQALVTYINPIAEKILGTTSEQCLGKGIDDVMQVLDAITGEKLVNPIHYALQEDRVVGVSPETCIQSPDYGRIDIEESSSPIKDTHGKSIGAITVFQDITAAKKTQEELAYVTNHDVLTKLPNRVLLIDRAEQALKRTSRSQLKTAFIVINIDDFQKINDIHGYVIGDRILVDIAQFLSSFIRDSDTLSRNSGDEFVLLFSEVNNSTQVRDFCARLLSSFGKKWSIGKLEFNLSITMGIAISPTDANDAQSLYRRADAAMHEAKRGGRNNYRFYSQKIEETLTQTYVSANELRKAISENKIEVFYQAKINDAQSRHISGVEALVRWRRDNGELIPPNAFIGLAEETRLIIPLGESVLRQACTEVKKWLKIQKDLTLAVNISPVQFNPGFINTLSKILEETSFPPANLEIEVTESVLINDSHAIENFGMLKDLGVKLSLDDFGTGYSSLSYVKNFPIDVLKIDQSFVLGMLNNKKDSSIVKTIINFAKDLHLEPVAEGVESLEHVELLTSLGCNIFQGFYFSRPVPASDMEALISESR